MSVKLLKQSAVSNPNLLINGDFQVWQRGTSFNNNVSNKYCADRWILSHGAYYNAMKIYKHEKGMQVTLTTSSGSGGGIYQYVENVVYGKTYTFSVSVNDEVYIVTGTPLSDGVEISKSFTDFKITLKWDNANKCIRVGVWFNTINKTYIINWVKLEYGVLNTMHVPRLYADDLALCERYYQNYSYLMLRNLSSTPSVLYGGFPMRTRMRIKPTYYSTLQTSQGSDISSDLADYYLNDNSVDYIQMKTTKADCITIKNLNLDAEIYPS